MLPPGTKIAILSPASSILPEYVEGAVATLTRMGLEPVVMPHTLETSGSFSATAADRLADITAALADPEIAAIICSRGGYGCVHLLPELDRLFLSGELQPKPLAGFSDVTALHLLWRRHGAWSVHASMTKHLALAGPDDPANITLLEMLSGDMPEVILSTGFSGSPYGKHSRQGSCTGRIIGGNLAVLGGLIGTPFLPAPDPAATIDPADRPILLIEDIAEPIYKVERILYQLRLAGIFDTLAGLIVGQFTDYRAPSRDFDDMYQMIDRFCADTHIPVAMDVPIGHIDHNTPLTLNRPVSMTVTPDKTVISPL